MTSDPDWARVRALFEAALDVAPADRAAWLGDACRGDDALRRRVEELIEADGEEATLAIDRGIAVDAAVAELEQPLRGARIGAYEIEGVLGSGGMSTVFLARQARPERRVALKTLRLGPTSAASRQRFAYESEVLARLRHPAIAQVFEVGTWREPLRGDEQPFFAMELVEDARTLTEHVRVRGLGTREALELFVRVCDGVEHGHRNGVVHRDLKPANLLVDAHGHPKIIDFGIARALDDGREALTEAGQLLGTLPYMAPEQLTAGADAVDTRADVYALGVVLYELLTGGVPHPPGRDGMGTFVRRVHHESWRPPSRVRSALAAELDWIVAAALAVDRDARYGSAAALAADLRRFLADEPLAVGPPTVRYRLRKFARRHRGVVAGALAAALALLVGLATTVWQMVRAEAARDVAVREARRAEAVNRILIGLLEAGDPNEGGAPADMTVREALDRAASQLEARPVEPEVEAEVRFALGNAYRSLGLLDASERQLRRVLELRAGLAPGRGDDLARAMNVLALTFDARGDRERAITWTRDALAAFEAVHGPRHPTVAMAALNLGAHLILTDRSDAGVAALRRAEAIYAALPGREYGGRRATALSHLAIHAQRSGDVDGAIESFRGALSAYADAGQDDHPYAAMTRARLGRLLCAEQRDVDDAVDLLDGAVRVLAAAYGDDAVITAGPRALLGTALLAVGRDGDAERHLTAAEGALTAARSTDGASLLEARLALSALRQRQGRSDDARAFAERAVEIATAELDATAVARARAQLDACR